MDILCLGDSLTYGYGVPREESWCALASRLTGHRFLNHGVNGASLSELQELVMDRDAWRAVIHGVAKSRTRLNN